VETLSKLTQEIFFSTYVMEYGVRVGLVVKALRYKPAGHGFDS